MNSDTNIKTAEISLPDQKKLRVEYEKFSDIRNQIINELIEHLTAILSSIDSAVSVKGRIKSFPSFYSKFLSLYKTGKTTFMTDIMGIRIICPFIQDIKAIEKLINKNFKVTENEKKGNFTYNEFGYESTHLLINIPDELLEKHGFPGIDIVELQIRTILQDAWAEVEHELVYKAEFNPVDSVKRKLAAVNASLSLADVIFKEIREHQSTYSSQMGTRRKSFYQKVEEATDYLLFPENPADIQFNTAAAEPVTEQDVSLFDDLTGENPSFDDLLINALIAHNQNRFNEAINQYTRILELKLDNKSSSVIYKHRGMANFACSCYDDAINDFSIALVCDPASYKAAYYRGIVSSVLKDYSKAIDDYTLSLSIYPVQGFCLFRRAQAYFHIGDYPAALADCENSLSVEPENEAAIKFKDILLEKINNLFLG